NAFARWGMSPTQTRCAPSPLVGEGWGGGWWILREQQPPPPLTPPHKGEGNRPSVCHRHTLASPSSCTQRRADALRRRREFVDRDIERRERVVDGVDDCSGRADGAALAEPLGLGDGGLAQRLQMVNLDRRDLARGRRQVVGERRGENVAAVVVDDLLEQ